MRALQWLKILVVSIASGLWRSGRRPLARPRRRFASAMIGGPVFMDGAFRPIDQVSVARISTAERSSRTWARMREAQDLVSRSAGLVAHIQPSWRGQPTTDACRCMRGEGGCSGVRSSG